MHHRPALLLLLLLCACADTPALQEGAPRPPLPSPSSQEAPSEPPLPPPPPAPALPPPAPTPATPPLFWVPERDSAGWPPLQAHVAAYALDIHPDDLALLEQRLWDRELQVPGRFSAHGQTWDVQVSYRGRSTRKAPKKSFQLRFAKDARFMGRRRIELLAEYRDASSLAEKLWYDTAAALGLHVPMARFVTLSLNGEPQGVMTELESVTQDFVAVHGLGEDADIYRCGMYDCELREPPQEPWQEPWEKRTNESAPWAPLWSLLERLNRTPPQDFARMLERELDVDRLLTWMALEAFIANDYQGDARSFLVREPGTGRWVLVPWDLNNAQALLERSRPANQSPRTRQPLPSFTAFDPRAYEISEFRQSLGLSEMRPVWCTVRTRLLLDPQLRARYVRRLEALLDGPLREEVLGPRIDGLAALLAPHLAQDPHALPEHTAASAAFFRRYVRERRAFLRTQLAALPGLTQGALKLDRAGRDAQGRRFVQVLNTSQEPVSLEGLYLTGSLREVRQAPPLSARVLAPGEWATFWEQPAEGELALEAQVDPLRPELGLWAADAHRPLDLLWLPRQAPGEALGRSPRGAEHFAPVSGP